MSKGIYLSPQHGVNPSVMLCFWCNKEKGVALLGRLPGDAEAPRAAAFDREPCDECKGYMEKGVLFISTRNGDAQSDNPYRTGGWCVIRDEDVKRMGIEPPQLLARILQQRVCFLTDDTWDTIGLPRGAVAEDKGGTDVSGA